MAARPEAPALSVARRQADQGGDAFGVTGAEFRQIGQQDDGGDLAGPRAERNSSQRCSSSRLGLDHGADRAITSALCRASRSRRSASRPRSPRPACTASIGTEKPRQIITVSMMRIFAGPVLERPFDEIKPEAAGSGGVSPVDGMTT